MRGVHPHFLVGDAPNPQSKRRCKRTYECAGEALLFLIASAEFERQFGMDLGCAALCL